MSSIGCVGDVTQQAYENTGTGECVSCSLSSSIERKEDLQFICSRSWYAVYSTTKDSMIQRVPGYVSTSMLSPGVRSTWSVKTCGLAARRGPKPPSTARRSVYRTPRNHRAFNFCILPPLWAPSGARKSFSRQLTDWGTLCFPRGKESVTRRSEAVCLARAALLTGGDAGAQVHVSPRVTSI